MASRPPTPPNSVISLMERLCLADKLRRNSGDAAGASPEPLLGRQDNDALSDGVMSGATSPTNIAASHASFEPSASPASGIGGPPGQGSIPVRPPSIASILYPEEGAIHGGPPSIASRLLPGLESIYDTPFPILLTGIIYLFWRGFAAARNTISCYAMDDQGRTRDLQMHALCTELHPGLFHARNRSPGRILDIGTGGGDWAIEVAERLPHAVVVATDIVDVLREDRPRNLHFELDNINRSWSRIRCSFDVVNVRHLLGDVKNHAALAEKSFHATTPGGTFQLTEICHRYVPSQGSWPGDSPWAEACQMAEKLQEKTKRMFIINRRALTTALAKAGFKNIHVIERYVPVKDYLQMVLDRVESLSLWDGHSNGSCCEGLALQVYHLRSRLASEADQAHMLYFQCWGQKPEFATPTPTELEMFDTPRAEVFARNRFINSLVRDVLLDAAQLPIYRAVYMWDPTILALVEIGILLHDLEVACGLVRDRFRRYVEHRRRCAARPLQGLEWALTGVEHPPPHTSCLLQPVLFLRSLFHLAGGTQRGPPMVGPGMKRIRAYCSTVDRIGNGPWPAEP